MEAVLNSIEDNGVTLNIDKCEFAKKKIQFLGHLISKDGIQADPSKVEAITQMEAPTKSSELRRFLGMVNQMGKYLPNLAQTSKPLRDLFIMDTAWIINNLEQVQRRATRFILGRDYSEYERLSKLNLLPLKYRREINDLVFFFKCFKNNIM